MTDRPGDPALPSTAEVCAYVWHWLDTHPGRRPRQADLAWMLGLTPRGLRRRWRHTGRASVRETTTYACLFYASRLIHTDGWKPIAAARQAGFTSYWNLNRQLKKYACCTASACRERFPFQLDMDEVSACLAALRAQSGSNPGGGGE